MKEGGSGKPDLSKSQLVCLEITPRIAAGAAWICFTTSGPESGAMEMLARSAILIQNATSRASQSSTSLREAWSLLASRTADRRVEAKRWKGTLSSGMPLRAVSVLVNSLELRFQFVVPARAS